MFEYFPELNEIKLIGFYGLMSTMRSLGFLSTFTLINFVFRRGSVIRAAVAISIGLPVAVMNQPFLIEIYYEDAIIKRLLLPPKEFLLGLVIGFLASLPFYGFQFAGILIDNYRGESNNGLNFEGSAQATTTSLLFYLVLMSVFLTNDGLYFIVKAIYKSYAFWPLQSFFPPINSVPVELIVYQLGNIFLTMLQVGLPLLVLLFIAEFTLAISSRVAKRFNLGTHSFLVKNVIVVLLFPIYVYHMSWSSEDYLYEIWNAGRYLEHIFK